MGRYSSRKRGFRERSALPDLRGKEVQLVSVTPQNMLENVCSIHLTVDGLHYRVLRRNCRDEFDAIRWLMRLQYKEQTNGNHC